MLQSQTVVRIETQGRGLHELTGGARAFVRRSGIEVGLLTVFCRHTSASLMIQENADPAVGRDLMAWLERLAPDGDPAHSHVAEGPDDMPAHLRTTLTSSSESIPIVRGELALGTWQGLFLIEHRYHPHAREVVYHALGEGAE